MAISSTCTLIWDHLYDCKGKNLLKGKWKLKDYNNFVKLPGHTNGAHIFRTMSQRAQHLSRLERALLRFCILMRGPSQLRRCIVGRNFEAFSLMCKLPVSCVYTARLQDTFLFTCWLVFIVGLRRQAWTATSGLRCSFRRLLAASFLFLYWFFRWICRSVITSFTSRSGYSYSEPTGMHAIELDIDFKLTLFN